MDPSKIDQNQQWLIPLFKNSKSLLCRKALLFVQGKQHLLRGSNEEVDLGSREDVNEGRATSESYQYFACHDGGSDMSGNQCIGK